jgi:2-desacetyl-2-hydroxyethyl bacteriochlorophyllide A dehydrogenase
MRTITLKEPGKLVLEETAEPGAIGPDEALVRVHCVGICGTDIHAFGGRQPFFSYPRVLGHELGVEVVNVGANDRGIRSGDRCSVEPYINCQTCIACRRGKPNCCANMKVMGVHLDGGMRDQMVVPIRKLHPANRLTYEQIALVETLAIGVHAVQRTAVESDETVLVIGAGPIGLSVIQFALARSRVLVMDINEARLAFCREKLGVAHTIDGRSEAVEQVRRLTHGDMPTVVIDATGNAESMNGALGFLANGGRLVYVGLFQGEFSLSDTEFHRRETTLMGSRNALPEDFSSIIRLVEEGKIDTRPWITHRAAAGEVSRFFPNWVNPASGLLKGIIEF